MIRRIAFATAALAALAALPAQAAPKGQLYYFGNTGAPNGNVCTATLQLLTIPTPNEECTGNTFAVAGNGFLKDEAYTTAKSATLKLDSSRPVTGTVYVVHIPAASGGAADSIPNLPGYAKGVATVKIDAVTVGTFPIDGVLMPQTGLKKDFSLPMPASLKNKTAKKVSVTIDWTDVVGLVNVSYTDPQASTITIPVK